MHHDFIVIIIFNHCHYDIHYLSCQVKRYRTYVYLLRSRLSSQQSGQQGTNAGIDVGDLPVFEARPAGEGAEGGERGARVVPPPIPERARPGDRYSYQQAVHHNAFLWPTTVCCADYHQLTEFSHPHHPITPYLTLASSASWLWGHQEIVFIPLWLNRSIALVTDKEGLPWKHSG